MILWNLVILGLFSGFGRCLIWEIDNIVEFIQICDYFMVNERFLIDLFRASFPLSYCHSFRENQFCEVLFAFEHVTLYRYIFDNYDVFWD